MIVPCWETQTLMRASRCLRKSLDFDVLFYMLLWSGHLSAIQSTTGKARDVIFADVIPKD